MRSAEQQREPLAPLENITKAMQNQPATAETGNLSREMSICEEPLTGNAVIDGRIQDHENSWDSVKTSLIEAQTIVENAKGQKWLDFRKLSQKVSSSSSEGEKQTDTCVTIA